MSIRFTGLRRVPKPTTLNRSNMESIQQRSATDLHAPSEKLQVFLFNVGQGDHILIKFPTGEYGIIDFYYDAANKIPEPPALSYFKVLKKELTPEEFENITISFFCISHTDKDHIKGVCETIKWFYDNNIFIQDFWLGAARDETQFFLFLKDKLPALMESMELEERLRFYHQMEQLKTGIGSFFEYFEKWKRKEFRSPRYAVEETGRGEYLVEIRPLNRPSGHTGTKAFNLGPLGTHIDSYINNMTFELVKNILGVDEGENEVDKNLVSHILRIQFGENNLLFGGDTHKEIWEDCLRAYQSSLGNFVQTFGPFDARFIKVSHHGSRNSSSPEIWQKIITDNGEAMLGISAGQHKKYRHPHSETIEHIQSTKKISSIFATNICSECILEMAPNKELHQWYDNFIESNHRFGKNATEYENVIERVIERVREPVSLQEIEGVGLLGYIFEFSDKATEPVIVRSALSRKIKRYECGYNQHNVRLYKKCYESCTKDAPK